MPGSLLLATVGFLVPVQVALDPWKGMPDLELGHLVLQDWILPLAGLGQVLGLTILTRGRAFLDHFGDADRFWAEASGLAAPGFALLSMAILGALGAGLPEFAAARAFWAGAWVQAMLLPMALVCLAAPADSLVRAALFCSGVWWIPAMAGDTAWGRAWTALLQPGWIDAFASPFGPAGTAFGGVLALWIAARCFRIASRAAR